MTALFVVIPVFDMGLLGWRWGIVTVCMVCVGVIIWIDYTIRLSAGENIIGIRPWVICPDNLTAGCTILPPHNHRISRSNLLIYGNIFLL